MFKLWNTRLIQARVCARDPFFQPFPGFAFSFEPPEPTVHPPYRYLPSVATPWGLVTNRFGFRGHELAPDKAPRVIRVAFVGASTTVGSHGQAYSYPEFIEPWLNLWAQETMPDVRFEIINAGREGISSPDIAAIVRQELAPLEPDLIVYHEGANQFTPGDLITVEGAAVAAPPDPIATRPVPGADYFALVRRAGVLFRRVRARSGAEPPKPPYKIKWPASVDEARPDPDAQALPLNLPQIVHDLDDIGRTSVSTGAQLVMTSFLWMVEDGMIVRGNNQPTFDRMLNGQHWPAKYADIRRMADFQNRVFRAYANTRGLPFVDVSTPYPHDLTLFTDPIHMTGDGDRLRAWIIFQGLVPILRAEIAAHRLPKADRAPFQAPPAPSPLPRAALDCLEFREHTPLPDALPLAGLSAADESSTVTGDRPKHVVTSRLPNGYAAAAPISASARVAGPGEVHVRLHVVSGRVAVGVLKTDRSAFLTYRTVETSRVPVDLYLQLPSLSDAGFLMVSNAVPKDGERSVVDIEDTQVLVAPGR